MIEGYPEQQARRQAELARHAENKARQAAAFAKMITTGQGAYEFPDVVQFNLAYVFEPHVSYGAFVDGDTLLNDLGLGESDPAPYPNCSGFVTAWDQDGNGFYTGAWVAVRVSFPTKYGPDGVTLVPEVPVDYGVNVIHYFRWEGISIKPFGTGDGI